MNDVIAVPGLVSKWRDLLVSVAASVVSDSVEMLFGLLSLLSLSTFFFLFLLCTVPALLGGATISAEGVVSSTKGSMVDIVDKYKKTGESRYGGGKW